MDVNDTLKNQMRTLRLSGILQTLDARHRQAVDAQWSYLDFLTRLLEDEVERRAQNQLGMRVRRGQLNSQKTLDTFSFAFNPALNRQKVLALCACDFIRERRNVLICGPSGSGSPISLRRLGKKRVGRATMSSSSLRTRCFSIWEPGAPTTPLSDA